ncbi:fibronectin type III domain-containing protein [Treponema porcinum]|uniref:Fibronectin type-III domain-containing protein n=2 Tax=Treponema TaxID=157 RepID=A0A1T4JJ42_TREPO|nr:hypothetical protein [Treponema porcinum]SJZ30171.1 hypothetical protein SAMN02745149_00397 [Treponema porcinum]
MKAGRFIIVFSTFFLLFSSCEQELLDSPSFNTRGSYSTGQIAPPANVSATQGGYRSVTLSWEPSKAARQYFIYSSSSSTGTFTKFAETSDASAFFTYKEDSGVLKYYRVTAVDYYGTESAFSALCYGSTLSAPVITKIAKDSSGTAVTVYWYGGANCFESTYLNSLCYEILLFDVDGTTVLKEVVADGTESSCTFTNLVANKQYYFQVKAYIKSNQDESHTEMSDKVNESTAHRLIPDAPAELTVSKGVSQDGILLSWKLPSSVDVKSGADYIPHPVYFKVLRKELSEPDEAYKPISTYIGVVKGKDSNLEKKLEASEYRINCAEGTAFTVDSEGTEIATDIITVTKPGDAEEQTNQYYPEYISGSTITFKDKTEVKIGKQYTYAVQSYTDDNGSKLMTSSDSIAVDSGWLITNPSLKMMSEPHYADDAKTEISEVTVSFTADFEDFGLTGTYKYVLYESFYKMDFKTDEQIGSKSELKEICAFDSINDILGYTKTYATEENYYYYYMYELKICSSADRSLVYNSVKAPGSVLVVKDASKQPVIENFKAEGGYTEYFKLSWSYNEMYAYTLKWKNTDKNELVTDENTLDLLADDENMTITEDNGKKTAVYIHPAKNGDRREYTLTAYNGMTDTETASEVKTLKIPDLSFSSVSYDKIEVSWDKDDVSNGTYTVTAHYDDEPENNLVTSVPTITKSDSRITCTIDKPYGYDDPEKSGRPITLSVSTASFTSGNEPSDEKEKKDKTAVANITVCTLGPALTGTVIEESDKDSILVQWNEVQGASGYKIYRTKYASNGTGDWTPEKVDVYYKDAGTSGEFRISEGEGTIGKKTTCTSTAGVYTLRDAYADSYDDTNPYSVNQSQIAWGLPYSYTVIPVLSENDFSGGDIIDAKFVLFSKDSKGAYTGGDGIGAFADKVKGSAFGYGLNLNASKASDTKNVSIIWTEPYGSADKVPYLYRRSYNDNNPVWSKVPVELYDVSNNNWIEFHVNEDDSDRCNPFDYLVSYDPQTVSSVHNSFIKEIERNENLDENGERACKGYAFTLPGITAKTGTGYSEEVYWEAYDYSKRAQGPESYEIFMRNDNKKDDWVKICTLKAGNNSQNATLNAETVNKEIYDIDLDFTGLSFTVQPSGIASGNASNTNGLLKVLRDAKHYYKIEAVRKVGGTTDIRASYGDDKSVYAYRQITDEELVKSVSLIMADAFNSTSENTTTYGSKGSLWWSGEYVSWSTPIRYALKYKISDYLHKWKNLPLLNESVPAYFVLSDSTDEDRGKAADKKPSFFCYKENKSFDKSKLIPITVTGTIDLKSYSGIYKFALSDSEFNVEIWRDNERTFSKYVTGDELKYWSPMKIAGNGYNGDNSSYGWWED